MLKLSIWWTLCGSIHTLYGMNDNFRWPTEVFLIPLMFRLLPLSNRRSCKYRQRHRGHPLLTFLPLQQPALRVHSSRGRSQHWGGGGKANREPVGIRALHHDSAHLAHDWTITLVHLTCSELNNQIQSAHICCSVSILSKHLSLCLSSSGAGASHGLWAARRSGGEPLLVSGDLTHGLLVLTWHSPLPVDFHLQAEDADF